MVSCNMHKEKSKSTTFSYYNILKLLIKKVLIKIECKIRFPEKISRNLALSPNFLRIQGMGRNQVWITPDIPLGPAAHLGT